MGTERDNRCPICLDSFDEVAYVMPCLHKFCYACIEHWVKSKPECPLCKRKITSIVHSVRADNDFEEHVITPHAVSAVVSHQARVVAGHPAAAENLHHPAASQVAAIGLGHLDPVGGIHPHIWATLFQEDPDLLLPVEQWLQQSLEPLFEGRHGEAEAAQSVILYSLRNFGPDEDILYWLLLIALGRHTRSFVHQLINTITERCSWMCLYQMGLRHACTTEEWVRRPTAVPDPAASRGGSPAPQEDPEESVPRPSTSTQSCQYSPGGSQQALKRSGSGPDVTSPPNKRPPRQQQ